MSLRKKNGRQKNARNTRIGTHDYEIKMKHMIEFLGKGYKVKIRMFFKGREFYHQEQGKRIMDKLLADIASEAKIEKEPKMMGRSIIAVFGPK